MRSIDVVNITAILSFIFGIVAYLSYVEFIFYGVLKAEPFAYMNLFVFMALVLVCALFAWVDDSGDK